MVQVFYKQSCINCSFFSGILNLITGIACHPAKCKWITYEICRVRSPLASFQLKLTSCFNYKKTNGSFFIIQIIGLAKSIDSFHCHGTKKQIGNRPVEEAKKMKCSGAPNGKF